ncbi:defective proboscis extension response 18 [Musca autumnalis]|uniref:defective proboscis extension response 18 n=1 Tax=Musca autumnalis TaxID=221902 RepID=UPI003CF4ECA9
MKSGTSYWTIPFVIHNLLTFAVVIGLQNYLLYKLTKRVTAVAAALPQSQTTAFGGATVAFGEGFQFNAFDTTRTTFASSSSSSYTSSIEGTGGTQMSSLPSFATSLATSLQPLAFSPSSSASSSSSSQAAYPTLISTTSSGFYNTKTSRIMSNLNSISSSIHPLSPTITTPTVHLLPHTTQHRASGSMHSKFTATHQTSPTTMGLSSSALPSFKNFMRSTKAYSGSTAGSYTSTTNSGKRHQQQHQQQQLPLDFTFSKNHWTNSDAALTSGGAGGEMVGDSVAVAGEGFRASGAAIGNIPTSMGSPAVAASSSSSLISSSSSSLPSSSSSISGNFRLGSSSKSSLVSETERPRIFRNRHHHEQHWGPFFEEPLNSTTSGDNSITTAHLYTEAVLNCRVGMLKDKTVMWVRRTSEKVSLLTVGNVTYSSDPRIRVKFQYPNNWRLLINPTQWDDAGIYMCQVSTHPPRVFTTNLTVIEPPLRLIDDQERDVGDRYYKTGSTIDLQCQVSRSFLYKEKQNILKSLRPLNGHNSGSVTPTASGSGNNFHNSTSSSSTNQTKLSASNHAPHINGVSPPRSLGTINGFASAINGQFPSTNNSHQNNNRPTATTTDDQSTMLENEFSNLVFWSKDDEDLPPAALKRLSSNDKWLTSRVTITDAKLSDSGNYSCSIGRLFTAIVQVQVLTGELPAAVQHNSATALFALCKTQSLPTLLGLMHLSWLFRYSRRWWWWCSWLIHFVAVAATTNVLFGDFILVMNTQ